MRCFLIDPSQVATGEIMLDGEESRHAATVTRIKTGEEVTLTDGAGRRYLAAANVVGKNQVSACIIRELSNNESPVNITALIGCLKSDKIELVTQKLTEIGVRSVIPVVMTRSVSRPETGVKDYRADRIAREAVKQSGRSIIPDTGVAVTWERALEIISNSDLCLMPWELARDKRIKDAFLERPNARDISILIGPEGGITGDEASQARSRGAIEITLGPRILRAETAAIAASCLVQSLWGDL